MKKWNLSTRIKIATMLTWVFAALACSPLLSTVYRLLNVPPAPIGDDEYMAITFWFLSFGIFFTLFLLLGFVHALHRRRTLQDQLPALENGDGKRAA
jgi:hypothetical protein